MTNVPIKTVKRTTPGKKALLAMTVVLILLSTNTFSAPKWFANLQLDITEVTPVAVVDEGLLADVTFEGSAGGAIFNRGRVSGVDHVLFDPAGNAHLNVYLSITDREGDQVSANITGIAVNLGPGRYVLQEASGIIINETDPVSGVFYATSGKFSNLVGETFVDIGFISGFSLAPAGGKVHAKWIF